MSEYEALVTEYAQKRVWVCADANYLILFVKTLEKSKPLREFSMHPRICYRM
jgi:hypothetical protein